MLIFAAILAMFVYGMTAAMLGTILPGLSDRFQLSPAQNGTIAFAQGLGLIIASIGVGPLLDAEGDKIGLVLGLSFIAIALFALPRSRGFRSIVALLFLLGCGGIVVTSVTVLVSAVSAAHRASSLNLVNLFFGLGAFATPFISANIFKKNWVRLCYIVASLTVVTLVIETIPKMPAPTGGTGFVLAEVGPVLGRPLLFMFALFIFLYLSCESGMWNWLPRHLIAQGIPEARALNILSFGFALGMLVGRAAVLPVLISVPPIIVTLAASSAMAVTTFLMLRTNRPAVASVLVFLAGAFMAPVFPTALAIVGAVFPRMTGTAMGFIVTCGWVGLAVTSRLIGAIAGSDPTRLKKALLLIPASATLMVILNLAIWGVLR